MRSPRLKHRKCLLLVYAFLFFKIDFWFISYHLMILSSNLGSKHPHAIFKGLKGWSFWDELLLTQGTVSGFLKDKLSVWVPEIFSSAFLGFLIFPIGLSIPACFLWAGIEHQLLPAFTALTAFCQLIADQRAGQRLGHYLLPRESTRGKPATAPLVH